MKTALISVFHKDGIVDFARALIKLGWQIISSGGTAAALKAAKVAVTDVAAYTGRGPILGHRVVTLDAKIHGALMATEEMRPELESLGYPWIDMVVVDLYPLIEEIGRPGATQESVIDRTDIGGPTLLRSAAKGRRIVVADPADRSKVIEWLKADCPDAATFVTQLCAKAEGIVANYCLSSARYHAGGAIDGTVGTRVRPCKYGENAWQEPAGLYARDNHDPLALARFELVEGDAPSYNNWCDVDRMLQTITHLAAGRACNDISWPYLAVGVKHGNACGAALGSTSLEALQKMINGNPQALFGGLVMTNFPIADEEAHCLRHWGMDEKDKRLFDGIVAPRFSDGARDELNRKGGKCRMLGNPALLFLSPESLDRSDRLRPVRGGFLKQPNYTFVLRLQDPNIKIMGTTPFREEAADLVLAWAVGCTSNSNTITLARNRQLIGNGVGQQDRVTAATLAVQQALRCGHDVIAAVAYSDSFFPFPDGPMVLAKAGVSTILTSSGSIRDDQVKNVCDTMHVRLIMIPDTLGRGFFGH